MRVQLKIFIIYWEILNINPLTYNIKSYKLSRLDVKKKSKVDL